MFCLARGGVALTCIGFAVEIPNNIRMVLCVDAEEEDSGELGSVLFVEGRIEGEKTEWSRFQREARELAERLRGFVME